MWHVFVFPRNQSVSVRSLLEGFFCVALTTLEMDKELFRKLASKIGITAVKVLRWVYQCSNHSLVLGRHCFNQNRIEHVDIPTELIRIHFQSSRRVHAIIPSEMCWTGLSDSHQQSPYLPWVGSDFDEISSRQGKILFLCVLMWNMSIHICTVKRVVI